MVDETDTVNCNHLPGFANWNICHGGMYWCCWLRSIGLITLSTMFFNISRHVYPISFLLQPVKNLLIFKVATTRIIMTVV